MDAAHRIGGLGVAGLILGIVGCALGATQAVAAPPPLRPASGTLDLFGLSSYDEEFRTPGGAPGARAYVGDVNGVYGDIAIGVPTADPGGRTDAGSVFVLYGGNPGGSVGSFGSIDLPSPGTRGYRIDGARAGDRLGTSIARLARPIGDAALSAFAVGAPGAGPDDRGIVYLVPGARGDRADIDLANDASLISVAGAAAGDRAGESLAAHPDLPRLVIGSPGADPGGRQDAGSAFLMTAVPTTVPGPRTISLASATGFRFDGRIAGGRAGTAVGLAADIDGDRRSEVLVGAPWIARGVAGEAYIVPFRRAGAAILGSSPNGGFRIVGLRGMALGASVAGLGDLSGDGLGDVAIGAPTASPGGRTRAGSVFVVKSRRGPPLSGVVLVDLHRLLRVDGIAPYDRLGTAVAAANVDGGPTADDLLVSAPKADALTRDAAGTIYAVPGRALKAGLPDLTRLGDAAVRLAGPRAFERMGTALAVGAPVPGTNRLDRSLAILGGMTSTVVLRLAAPVPAPARAPAGPARVPGCTARRDVELAIDGSPSMATAAPLLRTAIDALVSKPRSASLNLGTIEFGVKAAQVFPPLTVPTTGFGDPRDLRTLRLLLAEHITGGAGTPDYAAAIAAAADARPEATAIVLITDAKGPAPVAPLRFFGKRIYVMQLGGGPEVGAGAQLRDVARRSRGRYFPDQVRETLPTAWAVVEAAFTCEDRLTTQLARSLTSRPTGRGSDEPVEASLTPRRPEATFETALRPDTKTATLTFGFRTRGPAARAGRACARPDAVGLDGVRVSDGPREIVASPRQVARAIAGLPVTLGGVLRVTARCGPGFLVVQVSGLERLPGAGARAAASSAGRAVGIRTRLRRPPVPRKVSAVGIGKRRGGRRR